MTASVLDRHFTDDEISNARKPVTEASVLPLHCYTDEQFYRDEIETVLMHSWLPVGREDQLPNTGTILRLICWANQSSSYAVTITKSGRCRTCAGIARLRSSITAAATSRSSSVPITPGHTTWTAPCATRRSWTRRRDLIVPIAGCLRFRSSAGTGFCS